MNSFRNLIISVLAIAGTFSLIGCGVFNVESSCRSSLEIRTPQCEEMEQNILATTLRIEIRNYLYVEDQGLSEFSSNGYGTVMDGRYLLTHNHFKVPLLELLADDLDGKNAAILLYSADNMLLWEGPLTNVSARFVDSETLLLKILDHDGRGLFEQLGVPSENFPPSTPGLFFQELGGAAQINWDNQHAYVQWTTISETGVYEGTPMVTLSDCILIGASGGGLFIDGVHFANNWIRSWDCAEAAGVIQHIYSTAALNSPALLAHGETSSELVVNQGGRAAQTP